MNESAPTLSILIITWNSWGDLKNCLDSIWASEFRDYEVVVVDNASTDQTVENLSRYFPEVRVYVNKRNLGHSAGFNWGIQLVRGRFVLLLDADTELESNVISSLVEYLLKNPDISIAAPRLYNSDGSLQETAKNFPTAMSGLFGRQSLFTRLFPSNPFSRGYLLRDRLYERTPYFVQSVSAACMILPRKLVDEVGSWDEDYPGYWVDVDWCMQLHKRGKKVCCVPSLHVVHHEGNQRLKKRGARRIWMFNYGAYLLYRKHYTRGVWDPRALLALILLSLRTLLQIGWERVRFNRVPATPRRPAVSERRDVSP